MVKQRSHGIKANSSLRTARDRPVLCQPYLSSQQGPMPGALLGLLQGVPGLRPGVEARIRRGQARPKDRQVQTRPTAEAMQELRGVPDLQARQEQGLLRGLRREESLRGVQKARGQGLPGDLPDVPERREAAEEGREESGTAVCGRGYGLPAWHSEVTLGAPLRGCFLCFRLRVFFIAFVG